MPRSAGCLRSPRVLWRTPIDSSKEIAELCRTDRHDTVRRRRPQKTSALKTLREQTLPLSIVPQALDEITAPATKHEQVPVVRIALERLLNQQCQALVALPHIGVAGRQPNARAARKADHRRLSRTSMTRASAAASTPLSTITRRPPVSTISIRPDASTGHDEDGEFSGGSIRSGNDGRPLVEGSQLITACANIAPLSTSTRRPSRARRRHVNSWLADSPFRRAVADTCRRPSWLSLTIRRFSSNVQRRRAPVSITSSRDTFDIVV